MPYCSVPTVLPSILLGYMGTKAKIEVEAMEALLVTREPISAAIKTPINWVDFLQLCLVEKEANDSNSVTMQSHPTVSYAYK